MNVLIIEDEKHAAERLVKMLEERKENILVLAILDTVEASVAYLQKEAEPDLIFLDIQLGDGKSFEIFKKVNVRSRIIFTTAYDEYALKAFKYNSIDYLLKPLSQKELDFALQKYRQRLPPQAPLFDVYKLLEQIRPKRKEFKSRFLVKKGTRFFTIETDEVALAFTRERTSFIKKFTGEEFVIDEILDDLQEQLNPSNFFRVNRQFIVSYKAVAKIFAWFDGKLKIEVNPAGYEDIIISRLKAPEFKKWLGK